MRKIGPVLIAVLLSLTVVAQSDDDGVFSSSPFSSSARRVWCGKCRKYHTTTCPNTNNPPPQHVPIDGGLGALLAAGAAYGAKRMKAKGQGRKAVA